ncbi:uncharacterized protein METZ01_LOCUS474988, partial [marine metagenome]
EAVDWLQWQGVMAWSTWCHISLPRLSLA